MKKNIATILAKTIIRLILAFFFIGYFFNVPYDYYQIVRYVALAAFAIICYLDCRKGYHLSLFVSVIGIVLFNPFFIIPFKKETWETISEMVVYALIAWSLFEWAFWFLKERKKVRKQNKKIELTFDHAYYL